ncbi:MAG: S26 family signal peptidase [Tannerella sp.]|jgi:signal peptidase I|nr:S26 family signal peptidase [Tannerella sp.]
MKKITKKQWISFSIWAVLYTLFSVWMENLWLLFGLIVLADIYFTRFIPWRIWKKSKNRRVYEMLEWVDDILFALIAVYLINLFVFQNYQIPSSSLEKTLLVGDYLYVSKLSFGPRVPNTPLSFPLVQHTLPLLNCKSYLDWPQWGYKRLKGFGTVARNDIVVFNFPAGDTVALRMQNPDFHTHVHQYGREAVYSHPEIFGEIIYRPVDKRENYVKRCVGIPGDSLLLRENQLYINGEKMTNPENMQLNYYVETDGTPITEEQFRALDVSKADRILYSAETGNYNMLTYMGFKPNETGRFNLIYHLPLTEKSLALAQKMSFVKQIKVEQDIWSDVYPIEYETGWQRDNYGPIWIPKKGATVELNPLNLAIYTRCIVNYEHNTLQTLPDGSILINGKAATTYTFKYDYYFMMGDNRHNSADSRMWGFVPEDHVVGKPVMIWLSIDKDRKLFNGGIRWHRMFRMANKG